MSNNASLHPLSLLMSQLMQPQLKIKSINTVSTIAIGLGPQKTRQYLLPLLGAIFHQESLECQEAILNVLPTLISHIGHKFYSYLILQILMDILCLYDEKQIREKAFQSLEKVLGSVDIRRAEKALCNTLTKLATEKETRIKQLVLKMIPQIFIGLNSELQRDMMQLFMSMQKDEKEDIRLIVARQLKQLIKIMPPAPQSEIKSLVQQLLQDKSDKVRVQLVQALILLTQVLDESTTVVYFHNLFSDSNSKVKCQLYDRLEMMSQVLSQDTMMHFYQQIENYQDFDSEIKNRILKRLPMMLQVYPPDLKEKYVMPLLKPPSGYQLKMTLAQVLCQMKDQENLEALLSQGDNELKLKTLPKVTRISRYEQTLKSLLKHKGWRIRVSMLQNIESRLKNPESGEDFQKILHIIVQLLVDKVSVVRTTASNLISKIILQLKYPQESVVKMLQQYLESESWFTRLVTIQIVSKLIEDKAYLKLWETLRKSLEDKVPVIRREIVLVAQEIQKKYLIRSPMEECRKQLQNDQESCVRQLLA